MELLEDVLKRIEDLKADLHKEKIIKEGKCHYEPCQEYHTGWNIPCDDPGHEILVWDEEPVIELDTEKREAAIKELQHIYNSSKWYCAKFEAGSAFEVVEVFNQLEKWIDELKGEMSAVKNPNTESRLKALRDIRGMMFDLSINPDSIYGLKLKRLLYPSLRDSYKSDPSKQIRKEAGDILGYSKVRAWFHRFRR